MGEKIPSIHKDSQYNYNKTNPNKNRVHNSWNRALYVFMYTD